MVIGDGGNDSSACSEANVGIAVSNGALVPQGLCTMSLRCDGGRALIYVFSPGRRKEDLGNREAAALLEAAGYPSVHSGK